MTADQETRIVARCLRELADVLSSADSEYQLHYDGHDETFVFDPQWTRDSIVAKLHERCEELEAGSQWRELAKLCKDNVVKEGEG